MDFVSHALMGRVLASSPTTSKRDLWVIILFSVMPDIPHIANYLYLGYIKKRPLWIPHNSDWAGFRTLHPIGSALWEIPHSVIFLVLIIVPIVLILKLPKLALVAYSLHLLVDIATHTGEWSLKLFYPFDYTIEGFTDAWAWRLPYLIISWAALAILIIILKI